MKNTLLSLVAGATIGAGTVVTLPDGSTATAETPTVNDVYTSALVPTMSLSMDIESGICRYVYQRISPIAGVAPMVENRMRLNVESVFNDVAAAAQPVCEADPDCTWGGLRIAQLKGGILRASVKGSKTVIIEDKPQSLEDLHQQLIDGPPAPPAPQP